MTSRAPSAEPIRMPPASTATANPRRILAALLAVAWCAALAWLALATSNPVALNRAQIRTADAVVTARVENRATGKCRVVRQWTGHAVPGEIVVTGLDQSPAREEGEWLLPLLQTSGGFEVAPTALPSRARLVYPATDDVAAQMQTLVETPPVDMHHR